MTSRREKKAPRAGFVEALVALVVAGVLAAPGVSAAGALKVCLIERDACRNDLVACDGERGECTGDLSQCDHDLEESEGDGSQCQLNPADCEASAHR
jgi:hypothetical protein